MNVTTGEVIAERIARNDPATFISFLSRLDQSIPPGLDIHLICDNGSSHTSRAWLAAHPGITVTCTPKQCGVCTCRARRCASSPRSSGSATSGCTRRPEQEKKGRCSFCGKYRPAVAGLAMASPPATGRAGACLAICSECLELCDEICQEEVPPG